MTRSYQNKNQYSRRNTSVTAFFPKISLILLVSSILLASCEEDPTTIGRGILPETDFVNISAIDTIHAISYTMYDDSTQSDNPPASYLGSTWDPYFGTTTASFVSQIRLKQEWEGKPFVVDSVKLVMKFQTVRGNVTGQHYLNLFEITNDLRTDTSYYTNSRVSYGGLSIPGIPLPQLKADTVNLVEMKLDEANTALFANRILQDTSMLFHSNVIPDFRSYFKGLHITLTSDADPVLVSVNLQNNADGYLIIDRYYKNFFVIYYHGEDNTAKSFYLMLDAINRNASFNKIEHNRETAENPIRNVNEFIRDTVTYLQYLNGVYTRIVLPGLAGMKTNPAFANIAVNKARLTVPYFTDGEDFTNANVPRQVYVRYRTVNGSKPLVQDYIIDQQSFFDGLVDTTNQVFNFNLATYLQAYIEDKSGDILPELEIFQSSTNRNMIFRANHNSRPAKFELTYTRF